MTFLKPVDAAFKRSKNGRSQIERRGEEASMEGAAWGSAAGLNRRGRGARATALISTLVAVVALACASTSASAAPVLGLDVTHDPATPVTTDLRLTFTATVGNTAPVMAGDVATCDPKEWLTDGGPAPAFGYEWRRNGLPIAGATNPTYAIVAADAGAAIQCVVTGTNANGAEAFASLPAVVAAPAPATTPPGPPAGELFRSSRPTIDGSGSSMRTCAPPADWTAGTTYTYRWLRNGEPIIGATDSTYTPDAGVGGADVDKLLQCEALGSNAGGSVMVISRASVVGSVTAVPRNNEGQTPQVLVNATDGSPVAVQFTLPAGMRVYGVEPAVGVVANWGWTCSVVQPASVTCERSDTLRTGAAYPAIRVVASVLGEHPDPATVSVTASGGGAAASVLELENVSFTPGLPFGIAPNSFFARSLDGVGNDHTEAGGHPVSAVESFDFNRMVASNGWLRPNGNVRTIVTHLPSGFVGNPEAIPERCETVANILADTYSNPTCPSGSIVGTVTALVSAANSTGVIYKDGPLYAITPERGAPAQFMFGFPAAQSIYSVTPRLRPEDGYSIKVEAPAVTKSPQLMSVEVTLCGYGAKTQPHPFGAGFFGGEVGFAGCKQPTDADANPQPFLTNPPACFPQPPSTELLIDSWDAPGDFKSAIDEAPVMTGCDQVEFTPAVDISPSSSARDSASGLDADISVPTEGLLDPDGVSQAHLKKAVVTLPEGVTVNPSGATGLEGCSDAQLAFGADDPVACPDGSKIGRVEITTPLLKEHLFGDMILRTPKSTDPESGEMLRLVIVVESKERGILVKLPGSATADAKTGRLTATFDQNPQLPFSNLQVHLKAGPRGVLATPADCGQGASSSVLTPWGQSAPMSSSTPYSVAGDCAESFAPKLVAGMDNAKARGHGTFSFRFSREDGEQYLRGLTAKLPAGLLASVKDVPLCPNAQADAGACPAGSKIGIVDAKAGAGDPFVLERKGEVFLTEGYKGGAYGLMVKIRPVAGPFRGDMELSPIVVRQALYVDERTAQVTAVSDPFPLIHHGIPLRVREVTVIVNRPGFMLNPSDCSAKQVGATVASAEGTNAELANHFQAKGCAALPFKPRISMRNLDKGRRSTLRSWNPRMKFVVRQQGVGEAGISGARVTLPSSVILDQSNLDTTCTRAQMAAEDCPAGSIVGYAKAFSPLLNRPVQGPVFLAANGGVRPLPDVVAVLDGEIRVVLESWIDTVRRGGKGRLRSTFNAVPDAPVSRFVLTMRGGKKNGLLVNSADLCRTRERAVANFAGHNGKRSSSRPRIGLRFKGCKKVRRQAARRAAKRKTVRKMARQARAVRAGMAGRH